MKRGLRRAIELSRRCTWRVSAATAFSRKRGNRSRWVTTAIMLCHSTPRRGHVGHVGYLDRGACAHNARTYRKPHVSRVYRRSCTKTLPKDYNGAHRARSHRANYTFAVRSIGMIWKWSGRIREWRTDWDVCKIRESFVVKRLNPWTLRSSIIK